MAKDALPYTYSAEWRGTVDPRNLTHSWVKDTDDPTVERSWGRIPGPSHQIFTCPLSGPHDRDHVTKVQYPCPRQVDTLRYEKLGYSADATSRAHMFRAGMASHWATRARATCGCKTEMV
jgi:hypothetical protein